MPEGKDFDAMAAAVAKMLASTIEEAKRAETEGTATDIQKAILVIAREKLEIEV